MSERPKPISMYPPGFSAADEPATSSERPRPASMYPPGFSTPKLPGQIGMSFLPRALRTILVADGTVTKLLEAHFWEPIEVKVTQQGVVKEPTSLGSVDGAEEEVVHREVVLRRTRCDRVVAVARSLIVLGRLEPELQSRLLTGDGGIGALLRVRRLETYREQRGLVHRVAGDHDGELLGIAPESPVVERTYLIHRGGRPFIEITEIFPVEAFHE